MYLLILFLPFLNFILLCCFGRFIGKKGTIILTSICFFLCILIVICCFIDIIFKHTICEIILWEWVRINEINLYFNFLFDQTAIIMCFVVFSISSLVHFYSFGYMEEDPHFIRFISFLSLFTFFMLIIVTSSNFVQLFFGWECVGLASYLLINFWYTRIQANKSALKAIIVNKIGDLTIIAAILSLFYLTKTFDYNIIFNVLNYNNIQESFMLTNNIKINIITFINICLLIGVIAKSAQIGLHTWLVDAMEGPTPVSALLHAATMVTVGVFCLIRCNTLFIKTPNVLLLICFIGALTALFGSVVGLLQNDIKRVIAYSTCSQLGYMVTSCGLSFNELALYHLTNHAFFKALLFLSAGAVIHSLNGKQDMREMGNLLKLQPIVYIAFFIGSFALMGLPFFSGFYSKDLIIEFAYINKLNNILYLMIYNILILAAFFTAFYSTRLLYLTFFNSIKNINKISIINTHNLSYFLILPLICLSICSIILGWFFKDLFIGLGTDIFEGAYYLKHTLNFNLLYFNVELMPFLIKILPNILTLLAVLLAIYYSQNHAIIQQKYMFFFQIYIYLTTNFFFQKKLFFDFLYYVFLIKPTFIFSYNIMYKLIDRGFFEIIGPVGITYKLFIFSKKINNLYHNNFYHFLLYFILNIILLIILLAILLNIINLVYIANNSVLLIFLSVLIFFRILA